MSFFLFETRSLSPPPNLDMGQSKRSYIIYYITKKRKHQKRKGLYFFINLNLLMKLEKKVKNFL